MGRTRLVDSLEPATLKEGAKRQPHSRPDKGPWWGWEPKGTPPTVARGAVEPQGSRHHGSAHPAQRKCKKSSR